jgi:hypothetical protein
VERITIVNRKGENIQFIGAGSYSLKTSWIGGVTVYACGVPVGFFWKPISVCAGLASPDEIAQARDGKDKHDAAMMGVKL